MTLYMFVSIGDQVPEADFGIPDGADRHPFAVAEGGVTKAGNMFKWESSAKVRGRVETSCKRQRKYFQSTDIASKAVIRPAKVRKYCVLDDPARSR